MFNLIMNQQVCFLVYSEAIVHFSLYIRYNVYVNENNATEMKL